MCLLGAFQFWGELSAASRTWSKQLPIAAARIGISRAKRSRLHRMPGPQNRALNCLQPLSTVPLPMR